ncbi:MULTISPECIES: right-handed parallel beta-helix repeat-containing protein [unclassified Carboxylicivirga]|uniref:right-handed parallel beta-helix repeat-containing protein n=1 Tax=Carboxylicivirga TaxID=1628153 RepID=UPI003D33727F
MKKIFTLVVFLMGLTMGLFAQTLVSGFISTDSTWTVDGSPYEVISNLQITSSGSLTIDPGVEVWIESNTSIIVDGDLIANGTLGNRVLITSRKSPGSRAKGDWNEINVRTGGSASFNATTIEYGGYSSSYNIAYSCLSSSGGLITVADNCIIKDSNNSGLEIGNDGVVQIEGAQITACRWPVVYGSVASLICNLAAVDILGNTFNGAYVNFASVDSDMTLDTLPVPYVFNEELTIQSGSTLTVRAGNIIKINGPSVNVNGTFITEGSLSERVYITSYQNDGRGGDTNNDGTSTIAAPGNWDDIYVPAGGVAVFNATTIEYGGYSSTYNINYSSLYNNGGSITLADDCVIRESTNVGLRLNNGGNTHFESGQINDCRWPIVYHSASDLTFSHSNVDIADNTFNGAYVNFGYLNETMTLDTLNVPYVINGNLYVQSPAALNILAGNVIKFNNSNIYVRGILKANGSEDDIIYFTSYQNDNLGGDTNNDGAATPPAAGNWGSIRFEDGSDDAQCSITNADFSFGGRGNRAPVWVQNSSPTIENCNFENNYIGAYIEFDSSPSFRYNTIGSSSLVPFALTLDATPDFTDNTFSFSDNEYDAIGIISSTMVASATLPQRDVTGIPNVTYLLLGAVTIPEAITLTIDPGVVIKGRSQYHLFIVEGTLIADGQDNDNRITFTSVYDDTFGNPTDTNKDGSQTDPAIGNWGGIVFENTSDDERCVLNYTRLQYGSMPGRYYNTQYISGGEVTLENASPLITNNIIKDCHYGIYAFQASHPEVLNNEFVNTSYTPVAQSLNAMPQYAGNTFVNPGWTAIGIIGEKLGFDATLDKDTLAGYENISYVLLDNLTINSGTQVEVKPGIILKFNQNKAITVGGGFKCSGLDNDSITFTSIKDDNYGVPQDTKNDGDAESPSAGDWSTLRYTGTADDDYNNIIYTRLLYGGGNNYGVVTWVDAGGSIAASLISDSYYYGLRCDGVSTPNWSDRVIIQNCRLDPIAQSLLALPDMSFTSPDIASNGNGSNGIFILEGNLSSSAELAKQDVGGIYNIAYIIDRLTIGENAILNIEPGVVVKFRNYYSGITVDGALTANGTPEEKIVFTSIKDDSKGGDTNDDGVESNPQKNDWQRIVFNASALEEFNLLNNCILNYGAYTYSNYGKNRSMVDIFDAFVEVDSVQVEHSRYGGIGIFGSSNAVVTNSQFNNIDETPVIISMFAKPEFENNGVSNLGIVAIGVAQETYSLDDTIPQRDFGGIEDITYFIYNTLTVNSGTNIVIPAGTIFKTNGRSAFNVEGALQVNGEPGNPVVFTDLKDDAYGNPEDTNDNGEADSPVIRNVPVITYQDISNDDSCSVENAIFRYARSGINMQQAAPDISATLFENCTWGVELRGVSTPALTHSTFNDLTYAPMVISLVSFPRDTVNNVISGTTYKAIGILANEELVQDVTLRKNNFAGVRNIPYYFSGDYSIGTSVNLSIDPGVICKFHQGARLTVKRGLIAEGGATADSVIVFTDIKDDFFGGDTDSNGPYAYSNNYYNWDGILFTDEAYDDSCRLDHCVIRYAGYSSAEAAVAMDKASPLITNSSLTYNANGVRAAGASNPVINHCDLYGNTYFGVQNVDQAYIIDARYNYWGSNTGPTHASNPGGTGDAVTDRVDYSDFTSGGFTNPLMGDVSLNGHIQAYDASLILQHAASVITLSDLQQSVADVSGAAGITAYDASLVLQYVSGIISSFPAEVLKSSGETNVDVTAFFSLDDCYPEENEFTSRLKLSNANGLLGADITLYFNPEILQLKQVNEGDMNTLMSYSINNDEGTVDLAFAWSESAGGDGLLALFDFEVVTNSAAETLIGFEELLVNEQNFIGNSKEGLVVLPINTLLDEIEIDKAALHPIYPNPSDGFIEFYYDVADDDSQVSISAYAPDGTLITTLFTGALNSGRYHYSASDLDTYHGVVIIKLMVDDQLFTQKVVFK